MGFLLPSLFFWGNCNCICFRPGQVPLSVSTSRLYQLARNQKLMANRRDFCESIVYGNTIVCTWIPGTCRNIHTALSSMRGIVFYLPITKPQVALNLRETKKPSLIRLGFPFQFTPVRWLIFRALCCMYGKSQLRTDKKNQRAFTGEMFSHWKRAALQLLALTDGRWH